MGRKGMKGFMKSASRASSKPDEEVAGQPSSSTAEQPAHSAAAPSSSKPQPVAADSAANGTVEGAEREPGDSSKQESRGQMLQRHKRVGAGLSVCEPLYLCCFQPNPVVMVASAPDSNRKYCPPTNICKPALPLLSRPAAAHLIVIRNVISTTMSHLVTG